MKLMFATRSISTSRLVISVTMLRKQPRLLAHLEDAAQAKGPHEPILQLDAHHAAGTTNRRQSPVRTTLPSGVSLHHSAVRHKKRDVLEHFVHGSQHVLGSAPWCQVWPVQTRAVVSEQNLLAP